MKKSDLIHTLLSCLTLSLLLSIPAFAAEGYYLTWDEYQAAKGVDNWNYNDQAAVIAGVANHAVELYNNGEKEEAYEYAKATYWGYYEVSGFERNTMNYISGSRVSEVELAFTTLRKAVKKDRGGEAVRAAADDLIEKQCGQLKREVSKARLAVIAEFARGLLDGAGIMTPGDYLNPIAFLNCYGKNVFTSG